MLLSEILDFNLFTKLVNVINIFKVLSSVYDTGPHSGILSVDL